jgi:membrane-associated phospholipid phosphatase
LTQFTIHAQDKSDSTASNISALPDSSGSKKSGNLFDVIWSDFKSAGDDFLYSGNELMSLDEYDLLYFGGITGLTFSGTLFDEGLDNKRRVNSNRFINNVLDVANEFGEVTYALIFTGGLYTGGLLAGSDDTRVTARLMFESLALAGLTTTLLKVSFGRARPYMDKGNMDFQWFETSDDYNSFPSGHTTVAFAMASVAAKRIDTWQSYTFFFSGAALTGLARINKGKHWFSDIILGAAIGTVSGFVIVDAESQGRNGESDNISQKLFIYPLPNGIGFSLRL